MKRYFRMIAMLACAFIASGTISAQMLMQVNLKDGSHRNFHVNEISDITWIPVQAVAVDLGLSVKWASYNVGATCPEEFGDYFSWGETEPKKTYNHSSYKFYYNNGKYLLTKYCVDPEIGVFDMKTALETEDDAAHVIWGGTWRIPTREEAEELFSKCTITTTTQNDVDGFLVTGPNGNSIFFPANKCRNDEAQISERVWGAYWSTPLDETNSNRAGAFEIIEPTSRYDTFGGFTFSFRYLGFGIRPVTE